jgi:hypothetical protein
MKASPTLTVHKSRHEEPPKNEKRRACVPILLTGMVTTGKAGRSLDGDSGGCSGGTLRGTAVSRGSVARPHVCSNEDYHPEHLS